MLDQVICVLNNDELRHALLGEDNLNLDSAIKVIRAAEATAQQSANFCAGTMATIEAIRRPVKGKGKSSPEKSIDSSKRDNTTKTSSNQPEKNLFKVWLH